MERGLSILTKVPYKPFDNVTGFSLCVDILNKPQQLDFTCPETMRHYKLDLDNGSMIPRDGLLMAGFIKDHVSCKSVLDLGTGSGILAIHSAIFGAAKVVGVDINESALEGAKHNGYINGLTNLIYWKQSDLFDKLKGDKFDLILSNPPQLPMESGSAQDFGGSDGKELINNIITNASNYLTTNGILLIVLFDFLGVETSYNDRPTLKDLFTKSGFQMEVIARENAPIRKGGQTEKSIDYILKQYPKYMFTKDGDQVFHQKR